MPEYTGSRINQRLTNLSLKFQPEGFISDEILTPLEVMDFTGLISEYGNAHMQLITTRAFDRTGYRTAVSYDIKQDVTYRLISHGLMDIITPDMLREFKEPFDAEVDVNDGLNSLQMIEKEYECASLLRNTASYNSNNVETLSGTDQWSNKATTGAVSDPIKDIEDMKDKIFDASKKDVNTAVIPYQVFTRLKLHPKFTGIYGQTGQLRRVTLETMQDILEIPKIFVPKCSYVNRAQSHVTHWGKDVSLFALAPAQNRRIQTYGFNMWMAGRKARVGMQPHPFILNGRSLLRDAVYNFMVSDKNCGGLIKDAVN